LHHIKTFLWTKSFKADIQPSLYEETTRKEKIIIVSSSRNLIWLHYYC